MKNIFILILGVIIAYFTNTFNITTIIPGVLIGVAVYNILRSITLNN